MILATSDLATPVPRILERAQRFRVLHLFAQVVNLVSDSDEVVSLVGDRELLGPFAMVVPGLAAHLSTISPDSEARAGAGGIELPALVVRLAGARPWNPRPRWEATRAVARTPERGDVARTTVDLAWFDAGHRVASIAAAASPRDPARLVRAVTELAGRGEGLTPAGDDALVGILHALWARWSEERALAVSSVVAHAVHTRTTTLSASWVDAAARGEAAFPWHAWVDALASEEPPAARLSAAAGIRAIGDSSGRIALAAFQGAEAALATVS